MTVLEINENEFEEKVLRDKEEVYVDFFASWCIPCKKVLEKLENSNFKKIFKVDVDKCPNLAIKYNIQSIPTVLRFHQNNSIQVRI